VSNSRYPGLRPFARDEADIFFGHGRQTDELMRRPGGAAFHRRGRPLRLRQIIAGAYRSAGGAASGVSLPGRHSLADRGTRQPGRRRRRISNLGETFRRRNPGFGFANKEPSNPNRVARSNAAKSGSLGFQFSRISPFQIRGMLESCAMRLHRALADQLLRGALEAEMQSKRCAQ